MGFLSNLANLLKRTARNVGNVLTPGTPFGQANIGQIFKVGQGLTEPQTMQAEKTLGIQSPQTYSSQFLQQGLPLSQQPAFNQPLTRNAPTVGTTLAQQNQTVANQDMNRMLQTASPQAPQFYQAPQPAPIVPQPIEGQFQQPIVDSQSSGGTGITGGQSGGVGGPSSGINTPLGVMSYGNTQDPLQQMIDEEMLKKGQLPSSVQNLGDADLNKLLQLLSQPEGTGQNLASMFSGTQDNAVQKAQQIYLDTQKKLNDFYSSFEMGQSAIENQPIPMPLILGQQAQQQRQAQIEANRLQGDVEIAQTNLGFKEKEQARIDELAQREMERREERPGKLLDLATKYFGLKKLTQPEKTNMQEEYDYVKSQGYKGSLIDYLKFKATQYGTEKTGSTGGGRITGGSQFTETQLNKGAAYSGMSIADFGKLDPDTQNVFVNNQKSINNSKSLIDTAKENGEDPRTYEKEISESNLPPAVKDYLVKYLKDVFKEEYAKFASGNTSLPWWKRIF